MSNYKKKNCEPRPCTLCGKTFTPPHGNRRLCPDCRDKTKRNLGQDWIITYSNPYDVEQYEEKLRRRNVRRFRDTIVAIGYADRQREATLKMAGKVRTEL